MMMKYTCERIHNYVHFYCATLTFDLIVMTLTYLVASTFELVHFGQQPISGHITLRGLVFEWVSGFFT